jgi:hypothetical protein
MKNPQGQSPGLKTILTRNPIGLTVPENRLQFLVLILTQSEAYN